MKSIADQLPPEIARQIHPDRRKNEEAYWAVRDQLLDQYRGQWIGFADGTVIASGSSPVIWNIPRSLLFTCRTACVLSEVSCTEAPGIAWCWGS